MSAETHVDVAKRFIQEAAETLHLVGILFVSALDYGNYRFCYLQSKRNQRHVRTKVRNYALPAGV